jgi:uncharacterized protein (TIGR02996 family)
MDERTALLRAIADDPADHTRQLAFADWLDEHGEGERAERFRGYNGASREGASTPSRL